MTLFAVITVVYVLIFIYDFKRVKLTKNKTEMWVYLIIFGLSYVVTFGYCVFSSIPTLTGF